MRSLATTDYSFVLLRLLFVLTLQLTTTPSVMIQDVESFTLPVRSSSVRRRRLPIHTTTTTSASTTPLTVGYLTVSPEKEEGRGKGSDVPHGNGKDDEEQQQQQELQQQQPHQIHNMTTIITENENDNDTGECNRSKVHALELENEQLRQTISKLQNNVEEYRKSASVTNSKLVLENFEGEFSGTADAEVALMRGDEEAMERWCDSLPDGSCPVEPKVSFGEALRDRALWLIGLLLFQSASGIILAHNEELLIKHPIIVYYLTMLVGAGGNAGNQASVRVIRGLALGTLNPLTQSQFLIREAKMAVALSVLLSMAGFVRAILFRTPIPETLAVTAALFVIVITSVLLGAVLPLGLKRIGIDPAHSSTSIQVIMDILGVVLAVVMSTLILDSPLGVLLMNKLGAVSTTAFSVVTGRS